MSDKIYVGKGKKVGQYEIISASICIDDILPHAVKSDKNGKRYVNIDISQMRSPDQWGKTHTISINEWKPDPSKAKTQENQQPEKKEEIDYPSDDINPEDIPF